MSICPECRGSGITIKLANCADGTVDRYTYPCLCYDPSIHRPLPEPAPKLKEEIKCDGEDGCGKWIHEIDWIETEVYCEDCGSHSAERCPVCEEVYDGVWDERERRIV